MDSHTSKTKCAGNAKQKHVQRGSRGLGGRRTRGGREESHAWKEGKEGDRSWKHVVDRRPFLPQLSKKAMAARRKRRQRVFEQPEEEDGSPNQTKLDTEKATTASVRKEKRHDVVVPEEVEKAMAIVSQYMDMMEGIEGNGPTVEKGTCEVQELPVEEEDHVEDPPPCTRNEEEDAGEERDLDAVLWEFVGEAIILMHGIYKGKAKERMSVPPWQLFLQQVKAMVKQKKRAAELCIDKEIYEELLLGRGPLPTRDLKRVDSFPFLFKVPSRNKRNTPPRVVPCMRDWIRALSLVDEENHHAGNPLTLYRSMQRKGFAVPGFALCQLWTEMCHKCKSNAKLSARNDPIYKEYSMKELVRSFRAGARKP